MKSIAINHVDMYAKPAPGVTVPRQATNANAPDVPEQRRTEQPESLEKVVDDINQTVQRVARDIRFVVDKDSEKVIIKVFDQQTQEVIRELPPEGIRKAAAYLEKLSGILLQDEA